MVHDSLARDLFAEICRIPIIDPHSHIDPLWPASRSLDDILGYHYYTELAHSAGLSKLAMLHAQPRERVRMILRQMSDFDNTVQYRWFVEIARTFLNYQAERLSADDGDWLCDTAERVMADPHWEDHVLKHSNIEKVFLTNEFDDRLENFNTDRYVPCLRTDDLVFHWHRPDVRTRLAKTTGVDAADTRQLTFAITALFERFTRRGARACAISLPPDFAPAPVSPAELSTLLELPAAAATGADRMRLAGGIFWMLAEHCHAFRLPFDLMIGVNRRVYVQGVHQGQDLFDQRTSLIQYHRLFNAFPQVIFCVSVLTSSQNQELAGYSWIFPNVVTSGHWWYSNIPAYIAHDARSRLQSVPKTKQIGYYSDMYKLEFGLPKYNMYRRILAQILADDFIRTQVYTEEQALELARLLLRDNARRIFAV